MSAERHTEAAPRRSTATRFAQYAMASVALIAVALLASGIGSIYLLYSRSAEQFISLQQDKADFAAHRIEQFVERIQTQMVWTMLHPSGSLSREQRRSDLHKVLMQAPAVDQIAWLDPAGRLRSRASRFAADGDDDEDHSERPEFQEAQAQGLYVSPVFYRDAQPRLLVSLGTPDPHAGVTTAEVNLSFVWDVVTDLRATYGVFAYVVDRRDTLVAHPDVRPGTRWSEPAELPHLSVSLPAERFRSIAHRLRVARDDGGNEVLIASAPIPSLDWNVFVEFPLRDVLDPIHGSALRTGALLALALLLALMAGLLLTRRMVQPLQALEAGAAHLGAELESMSRLKRFFSPQVADAILETTTPESDPLRSHRSEITAVFIDLRGYTALTESGDPDEVMQLMREYHAAMGRIIMDAQGTLERFAGDGMLVFFNDPLAVPDHALRAVRMARAMQRAFTHLAGEWRLRGHDLQIGIGIAQGPATLGAIGFEGRLDYGAVGSVCSLAARLSDEAGGGQILVCARVMSSTGTAVAARFLGLFSLKGFHRQVPVFEVT